MILKEWQHKFGLDNWHITLEYDPNLQQITKTEGDPRYQEAIITYQGNEGSLIPDKVIVHELIHIVMSMYDFYVYNKIKDNDTLNVSRESAVSELSEIFLRNWSDKNEMQETRKKELSKV